MYFLKYVISTKLLYISRLRQVYDVVYPVPYVSHLEFGGHIEFLWLHIYIFVILLNLSPCEVACLYHKVTNYSYICLTIE